MEVHDPSVRRVRCAWSCHEDGNLTGGGRFVLIYPYVGEFIDISIIHEYGVGEVIEGLRDTLNAVVCVVIGTHEAVLCPDQGYAGCPDRSFGDVVVASRYGAVADHLVIDPVGGITICVLYLLVVRGRRGCRR